ncbi:MAG: histidine phosphatase family protein [Phycisphaeraceae bacterium]
MMGQTDQHHVVYLVGSGLTTWQEQNRLQGDTDLALSEAGLLAAREQAQQWMATRQEQPGAAAVRTIHCSPDEASQQTAAVYAELAGAKVKVHPDLAEMHLGLWQGLTVEELRERYRTVFSEWHTDCGGPTVPQGELPDEAVRRLRLAFKRLAKGHDALVLVLRPMMLRLCTAWLTGDVDKRRLSEPMAVVEKIELDAQAWRGLRSPNVKKVPA